MIIVLYMKLSFSSRFLL